jgi:glucose-1-phosphate cytidylyltransferase
MNILILCGGRGIIDSETRQRIPKALIQIGGKPLIWHVMKIFSTQGYNNFILALGEGGDAIRRHFYHQHIEHMVYYLQ